MGSVSFRGACGWWTGSDVSEKEEFCGEKGVGGEKEGVGGERERVGVDVAEKETEKHVDLTEDGKENNETEYSDSEREEGNNEPVQDVELGAAIRSVGSNVKNVGVDRESVFWSLKESVGYISSFMIYNSQFLCEMQQSHKEIVDLCFCDLKDDSLSM